MTDTPSLTAVITCGADAEDPVRQLKLVVSALPPDAQVVLVQSEDSEHPVRSVDSELGLMVALSGPFTHTRARTLAARKASGELLLFCELPVEGQADWVGTLLEVASRPDVGICGPALAVLEAPDSRVGGLSFVDAALNIRWLEVPTQVEAVPALHRCVLAMKRSVYEAAGGFDDQFDDQFSNLDLCIRVWRLGHRCVVAPRAQVSYAFTAQGETELDWDRFIYNVLRLGSIHLDPDDLARTTESLRSHQSYPNAAAALVQGDAAKRRAEVAERSLEETGVLLRRLCGDFFADAGTNDDQGDYSSVNRSAWTYWSGVDTLASRPVDSSELLRARELLDPDDWLPWEEISTVLCLGAAGGRQAPLFASQGCRVTLLDLSAGQLDIDRRTAQEHGFSIELIEGDMLDLSVLYERKFDLVYQPISACYVPDVERVYVEVARVLRQGGSYWLEHWNPVQMQMLDGGGWDGSGYRLVHPQGTSRAVPWNVTGTGEGGGAPVISWHYIHPIGALVGGLFRSGFRVEHFEEGWPGDPYAEPASELHLAAFAPPFLRMSARRD